MSKYGALRTHLASKAGDRIAMTFQEIEDVLGFKLPRSKAYPAWWSNNPTNNVMTNEWLAAGFKTEQVDIKGQKLVFRRVEQTKGRGFAEPTTSKVKPPRRHPGFLMKGLMTVAPGTDLTAPTGGEWGGSE
jgi:hypothetical protein